MRRSLIVIPLALPAGWPADYELQTAKELAKKHTVMLFAIGEGRSARTFMLRPEPFLRKLSRNLFVFSPFYVIPFQRFASIARLNTWFAARQLKLLIARNHRWQRLPKIFWTFSLQHTVLPRHLGRGYTTLYDCVDAFVSSNKQTNRVWQSAENQILEHSRVVFTNNERLKKWVGKRHSHVFQVPIGFNPHLFTAKKQGEPQDLSTIPHPRVGLVGTINHRFDFSLLCDVARALPEHSFVFVGALDAQFDGLPGVDLQEEIARLRSLPNTYFLGRKPKNKLASYYAHLDLGFIPYDVGLEFNRYSFPMKTLEYFWAGLPVVATPLPAIAPLSPFVTSINSAKEAAAAIKRLTDKPWPQSYQARQRSYARANSWEKKLSAIEAILTRHFPKKFL